jgi:hypothetical protein
MPVVNEKIQGSWSGARLKAQGGVAPVARQEPSFDFC